MTPFTHMELETYERIPQEQLPRTKEEKLRAN